ncbi:recombinase family protein [Nonomuraea sp. NPDC051191]|uniref:recombinase family protein n=1 Tax=Nonomuraea sp. NPDC051191 TaxID=3364372 RepID=UPI0037AF0FF7
MRALLAIRLSVLTDETTSPERQLAWTSGEAERRGWSVVGEAVDLDVSATKTSPFERPNLGKWLNERAHEFDAVIWWKQDRAVRSMADMAELAKWAKQNRKVLVFAEGPSGGPISFDLSSDIVAELIFMIFAFAAQMEAQSISDRTTDAKKYMRRIGRHPGGSVPYGYMAVGTSSGWRLVHDPVYAPIIQGIVNQVLAGHSVRSLARDLTLQGIPTPKDLQRIRNGKWHPPMALRHWSPAGLTEILRSRNLLGQQTFKGGNGRGPEEVVRGDDGMPVMRGEPLVSRATWDQLQEVLNERTMKKSGSRANASLLLRVLFCAICSQPMHENRSSRGERYYKCASGKLFPCGNRSIQSDKVETLFVRNLFTLLGDLPRFVERRLPGEDHTEELKELQANYEAVSVQLASARSSTARVTAQRNMDALDARIAALEALPVVAPRTDWVPTGETWGEYWESLDVSEKNAFLRSSGVFMSYVKVMPGGRAWVDASDSESMPQVVYVPPPVAPSPRSRQGEPFFHMHFGIFPELAAKAVGVPSQTLSGMLDAVARAEG